MNHKKISTLLLALFLLLHLSGCQTFGQPKKVEKKQKSSPSGLSETTAVAEENEIPVLEITDDGTDEFLVPLNDGAVFNLVPESVLQFLNAAAKYKTTDYSYTLKNQYHIDTLPDPVRLSWSYKTAGNIEKAEVLVSRQADCSQATVYEAIPPRPTAEKGSIFLVNLQSGTTYYWQVRLTQNDGKIVHSRICTFKTADGIRLLNIPGVENIRDLGGWRTACGISVKQGLLYRSAKIDCLTSEGKEILSQQLQVKTELDLRGDCEREIPKSTLDSTVHYLNIPCSSYRCFTEDCSTAGRVLRPFAVLENYPILFHGEEGAHRTGTLAFLLNGLLGVSENDLAADYELSPCCTRNRSGECDFPGLITAIKSHAGATLQEKIIRFCHEQCDLTEMELSNIRNILLTDSPVFASQSLGIQTAEPGQSVDFALLLRNAQYVTGVTLDGTPADYTVFGSILRVTVNGSGKIPGMIHFNDGSSLSFEVALKTAF